METVSYKTNSAIITLQIQDIISALTELARDYQNQDSQDLLEVLSAAPGDNLQVTQDNRVLRYVAVQLLDSGKGQATCLLCNKSYPADQLTKFSIGAGESPFNVRIKSGGILKRLFRRKRRNPAMFGGKGFRCPAGHDLISVITWIT